MDKSITITATMRFLPDIQHSISFQISSIDPAMDERLTKDIPFALDSAVNVGAATMATILQACVNGGRGTKEVILKEIMAKIDIFYDPQGNLRVETRSTFNGN